MDTKKEVNEQEPKTEKKGSAVDTGRRIDVSGIRSRTTTVRSRSPKNYHKETKEVYSEEPSPRKEISTIKDPEVPVGQPAEVKPKDHLVETKRTLLYVEPMEFDESGDFASLLEESDDGAVPSSFKIGDKVTGKVVHIGKEHIFVALSPKVEASIDASEFSDESGKVNLRVGQKISAYIVSVTGGVTLSQRVSQSGIDGALLEEAYAKKIPVEGKVLSVNKGGFDVQISGKRAFCPVGQIDIRFVEDTNSFVGKILSFLIERIEESGRNIVVSRRALLERERLEKAKETVKGLEINKKYDAVITRVADFGAFADIGGLEGLIPRSEISHGHIERVSDTVSTGDRVQVVVLSFEINDKDPTKSKLSFSLKKTKDDPFTLHWSKVKAGETLEGRVVRLESFGAFVELFPGIDGLIHISELSENRVAHPKEVLSIGDPVTVRVISANDEDRRISLSLRESVQRKKDTEAFAVSKLERGQKASGLVARVERYGVFLELENGVSALLPQSETGLSRDADLARAFKIGDRIEVVVIDIDAKNRVRVSVLARKQMEERDSYLQFQAKENASSGFGTFADLLKKKR